MPSKINWKKGNLQRIDDLPQGDPLIASAIAEYGDYINTRRSSQRWAWTVSWIENFLFLAGRHYVDDILTNRVSSSGTGDENVSVIREVLDNIPRPVNDFLGRYVETNVALLTENRPMPRVTPKSDDIRDQRAAEISELTIEYLWEALNMPDMHREIAKLIMLTGVVWMEAIWDDAIVRRMTVPQTEEEKTSLVQGPEGFEPVRVPVSRQVTKFDEQGRPVYTDIEEFGDISARIVTPFEMHFPNVHYWNGEDMGWVMREYYTSIDDLRDKYELAAKKKGNKINKRNGWFLENLDGIQSQNVTQIPLWWWERMSALVEGPGPSLYVGTPDQWDNHTIVRIFDRKPNLKWPRGRTVIVAGSKVLYDSPPKVGARAYNPRWPNRWHPYIRFRGESMPGSIYGRSLVSKLLPKLKRVNAIDTTMIMYRRTIPVSAWVSPKGAHPVNDIWLGRPGTVWEYDPRRTNNQTPQPIFSPPFPESIVREREQQIAEMEAIAGTEEILRGQRPTGVNSAAMIEILRKQALAGRSSTLQAWDESQQLLGQVLLEEVIKNVREDPRYLERIRILARERHSRLSLTSFSGTDLSDNVVIRVDTFSQALISKEAKEARAVEFLQYAPALMQLPLGLQQAILGHLGYDKALNPQGEDVDRARRMIGWIKSGDFGRVIPMPEDNPYVFYEFLNKEIKGDGFWDLGEEQQGLLLQLMDLYKRVIQEREAQLQQQQLAAAQIEAASRGRGPVGGGQ